MRNVSVEAMDQAWVKVSDQVSVFLDTTSRHFKLTVIPFGAGGK